MTIWLRAVAALVWKDLRSELRTRYALNALVMFVLATVVIVHFAVGQAPLGTEATAGLLWLVLFFAGTGGLARAFVSEAERGTMLLLQLSGRASVIYAGKFLFNLLLTVGLSALTVGLFLVFLPLSIAAWPQFLLALGLSAVGLAGATTLISALISRASGKGTLFAVLAFPVLLPLLVTGVHATVGASVGVDWPTALDDLKLLLAYDGAVVTAATLLFDYVWHD